jgi:hypothetical protein
VRHFFVGLGAFSALLAVVGFGPALVSFFAGQRFIPPIVHVHGIVMMTWVVLFTVQARLAGRGSLERHRQIGWTMTGLAALVWLSMGVATIVALQRFDPDRFAFLVQPLLIQLGTMVVFPVFVTWGVLARKQAAWHKRMMSFATFALVQAALDRMHWLPDEGLPMFWHFGLRLYVLLVLPLIVFDLLTLRRIHPATVAGTGIVVAMHAVVSYCWSNEAWNQLARSFWLWLR